jgi:hypothetical protein
MKPGSNPFRGEPPPRSKSRLNSQREGRKFEAKRRQKRGSDEISEIEELAENLISEATLNAAKEKGWL